MKQLMCCRKQEADCVAERRLRRCPDVASCWVTNRSHNSSCCKAPAAVLTPIHLCRCSRQAPEGEGSRPAGHCAAAVPAWWVHCEIRFTTLCITTVGKGQSLAMQTHSGCQLCIATVPRMQSSYLFAQRRAAQAPRSCSKHLVNPHRVAVHCTQPRRAAAAPRTCSKRARWTALTASRASMYGLTLRQAPSPPRQARHNVSHSVPFPFV